MLETSDGHGRLELMKFHAPPVRGGDRHAPANTLGIRRVAFAVDDIDAAVAGLQARGAELVGRVERYEQPLRGFIARGGDWVARALLRGDPPEGCAILVDMVDGELTVMPVSGPPPETRAAA
jgi:hypothetical protein